LQAARTARGKNEAKRGLSLSHAGRSLFGAPITSAAAANIELAIKRGVFRIDMLDIAAVLRRNVTRTRLAVADWRAADQSRVLHQRWGRCRTCAPGRRSRVSDGLCNRHWTVEQSH
jgi:hypothetical protein